MWMVVYSPKQGKIEVESFLDSPWCSHSEQNRRKKLHRDSLEGLLSWWGGFCMSFGGCLSVTMPWLLKSYLCVSFCLELIVSVRCHELQGIRVQMVWCLFIKMYFSQKCHLLMRHCSRLEAAVAFLWAQIALRQQQPCSEPKRTAAQPSVPRVALTDLSLRSCPITFMKNKPGHWLGLTPVQCDWGPQLHKWADYWYLLSKKNGPKC